MKQKKVNRRQKCSETWHMSLDGRLRLNWRSSHIAVKLKIKRLPETDQIHLKADVAVGPKGYQIC